MFIVLTRGSLWSLAKFGKTVDGGMPARPARRKIFSSPTFSSEMGGLATFCSAKGLFDNNLDTGDDLAHESKPPC